MENAMTMTEIAIEFLESLENQYGISTDHWNAVVDEEKCHLDLTINGYTFLFGIGGTLGQQFIDKMANSYYKEFATGISLGELDQIFSVEICEEEDFAVVEVSYMYGKYIIGLCRGNEFWTRDDRNSNCAELYNRRFINTTLKIEETEAIEYGDPYDSDRDDPCWSWSSDDIMVYNDHNIIKYPSPECDYNLGRVDSTVTVTDRKVEVTVMFFSSNKKIHRKWTFELDERNHVIKSVKDLDGEWWGTNLTSIIDLQDSPLAINGYEDKSVAKYKGAFLWITSQNDMFVKLGKAWVPIDQKYVKSHGHMFLPKKVLNELTIWKGISACEE